MEQAPPPCTAPRIEEKLARLCERHHLHSDVLPRCVVIMLELALQRFMCSFAACVMHFIEQYRAGTLQPWPETEEVPAKPRYTMKSPPVALKRKAGAKRVLGTVEACEALEVLETLEAVEAQTSPVLRQRQMWAGRAEVRVLPSCGSMQPLVVFWPLDDRCRSAMAFNAAEMRRNNCVQIVPVS